MKLVHGGDIIGFMEEYGEKPIDFSANVSPLGLPESVRAAVLSSLESADIYPDPLCRKLCAKIAEYEGVKAGHILCGNGASDIIFRLVLGLKPKRALVTSPTFAGYAEALAVLGCEINRHLLKKENNFDLTEDIIRDIDNQTDIVFICNPNNPTGRTVDIALLQRILERCEKCGCILMVDECFIEFLPNNEERTMKSFLTSKHLFLLKAFTKQFAMAGIRLGYGITSDDRIIKKARCAGQTWSVSHVAQEAGIAALCDNEYLKRLNEKIVEWKEKLMAVLDRDDIEVIGNSANYVFFCSKIKDLQTQLAKKGILIRSCKNYDGLSEDYYRVAVRDENDIAVFENAMRDIY